MIKRLGKGLLPLLILLAGAGIGLGLFATPQTAKKRPHQDAQALLVETAPYERGTYTASVEAMGRIVPAMEAALKAQVAGEIIMAESEFLPGGFVSEGDPLLHIDPADYEIAVKKQEAVLKQAQADYSLEQGRQDVAKDEMEILARTTGKKLDNPDLALRKPQLEQAKAEIEKARADLAAVKLDLQRTTVTAPFNALITARNATAGDKIGPADTLAILAGTDEYWIELSVPVHSLRWLDIPRQHGDKGSAAVIMLDNGRGERQGTLLKLTGSLDRESRLATLLASVPDPLLLDAPDSDKTPLILGDYVHVRLDGKEMKNVARIPLSWLRGDNIVWVNEGGVLRFRLVDILYEDKQYAYISHGLLSDDTIVTSDIAVPVDGMKLRTMNEARSDVQDKMKGLMGNKE